MLSVDKQLQQFVLHAVDFGAWKILITDLESLWKVLEFIVLTAVWTL